MADVTLTLIPDGDGFRVKLPDGRMFETARHFAWPSKEAAEAAVREYFGELRAAAEAVRPDEVWDFGPWAKAHGKSQVDVFADVALLQIGTEASSDEPAQPPPQEPDEVRELRGGISARLAALESRRIALSVEMLELGGAIASLSGRLDALDTLSELAKSQAEDREAFLAKAAELGVQIGEEPPD